MMLFVFDVASEQYEVNLIVSIDKIDRLGDLAKGYWSFEYI